MVESRLVGINRVVVGSPDSESGWSHSTRPFADSGPRSWQAEVIFPTWLLRLYTSTFQQPALCGVNRRFGPPIRRTPSRVWRQNHRALSALGTCLFRTSFRPCLRCQTRTPVKALVQSQETRLDRGKFRRVETVVRLHSWRGKPRHPTSGNAISLKQCNTL